MEAELSSSLINAGLDLAGVGEPIASDTPADDTRAPTAERFGPHQVLSYAIGDGAENHRRIMRVLYLEHQAFGLRLRPAQVADRLRERYAQSIDIDWLEQRLDALKRWGAVERDHDASLASSAAEWRRNRYTYEVTSAGRLTEELLYRLDALGEEIGRLDAARLPSISEALSRLAQELAREEPEGAKLRELFERLLTEVEALHVGALAFMRSLGELMRTVEQIGEDEFERGKGALLEHLQGFRRSRAQHSSEILELLEQIEQDGAKQLVARIIATEEFVQMPGGASVEEQRASRSAELFERWGGLRAWFVGDQDSNSPWRALNDQVVDAIRAVLAIAERLIERHSQRVDRARVLLHLAAHVAAAPPGEPTAWLRAAIGLRTPRHVGVPEADPEQVVDRGRTSWLRAPPAPVVAHLRTPGARKPGGGRGAPIVDLGEGRLRFQERREAERRELEALLTRLSARGPIKLSGIERVEANEFRHVLGWLGRAYETPPGTDGARRASSLDGRAAIVLHPPPNPQRERTLLRAPHGTLELPDFHIEVLIR